MPFQLPVLLCPNSTYILTFNFAIRLVSGLSFMYVNIMLRKNGRSGLIAVQCYASAALAIIRYLLVRLFVCVSVTFVDCVKTNKHIFKIFSPSGSHTILVFCTPNVIAISDGEPLTGASNAGGVG